MKPFGKDFYRALMIGFLLGTAGMMLSGARWQPHGTTTPHTTASPKALPHQ